MRIWAGIVLAAAVSCTSKSSQDVSLPSGDHTVAIPDGGTEWPKTLVFGLTPYLPKDELREEYRPLVEYLGRNLGLATEFRFADSYAELGQMLTTYKVHVALLSPFNYVWAKRENPSIILLATPVVDGSTTYTGYIVSRGNGETKSLADLRGKRFAFVDERSASGYLYPLVYLRRHGMEPKEFFGSVIFAGNHGKLVEMVEKGEVDGGATFAIAIEGEDVRILAKTGSIPMDTYCASPRLDQRLITRMRELMVGLSTRTQQGRLILSHTHTNGFVVVGDDHFDGLRRVAREVELR